MKPAVSVVLDAPATLTRIAKNSARAARQEIEPIGFIAGEGFARVYRTAHLRPDLLLCCLRAPTQNRLPGAMKPAKINIQKAASHGQKHKAHRKPYQKARPDCGQGSRNTPKVEID